MNLNKVVLEPSVTKKGTYGINHCQNGLIFYKDNIKYINDDQEFFKKIGFTYSPLMIADKDSKISYYEFDDDLYCNTLYDALYFDGKYWNKRRKWFKILEKSMINNYRIMDMKDTQSAKFFVDRVDKIKKSMKYSKNSDLLKETEDFIKNIDRYSFRAYISNGDLTDTNICLNNKICDTECFGYNLIVSDLAIFFISMIYGRWIYPKYNFKAYKFRKNKIVNTKLGINKKQLDMLKRIIRLIKPIEFDAFKKLVIMRLITPIGLDEMEEKDRVLVDGLIRVVYISNINNLVHNIEVYAKNS